MKRGRKGDDYPLTRICGLYDSSTLTDGPTFNVATSNLQNRGHTISPDREQGNSSAARRHDRPKTLSYALGSPEVAAKELLYQLFFNPEKCDTIQKNVLTILGPSVNSLLLNTESRRALMSVLEASETV